MEKEFDCLKMKEEIQAKIYEEIKDLPSSEIVAYFRDTYISVLHFLRTTAPLRHHEVAP
jgi:hypothetical protein